MNTNETLHDWAKSLLSIIHGIDNTVEGGISGMGSQDGHWISRTRATELRERFEGLDGYSVDDNPDECDGLTGKPFKEFCVTKDDDPERGFTVYWDEDVPSCARLCFFGDDPPHPLDKLASDQATTDELTTMRDIFDRTTNPEGVSQEEFAKILRWVGEQGSIKRAQERFENAMQPLMEWLKQRREEEGIPTSDGDCLGEWTDIVGRYIWDHWDD